LPGGTQALNRRELWNTKRIFFLTPQIMVNDLSRGTCPAVDIKCLVIDEAHKALGNHAYCQVVRELIKYTNQFRILALSATPGSDTKAVQQVISNLLIAQIEQCSEDSPEVQPYSHERQVEKIVVPLGEELAEIQRAYILVLEAFAGRLIKIGVLARRDIPSLTKYQIILARDQYRKNPASRNLGIHQGVVEGDFALCISLYHGYELLLQMGARSLFIYLCGIMDGSKGEMSSKPAFLPSPPLLASFTSLSQNLPLCYRFNRILYCFISFLSLEKKGEFIYGHPKLRKLEEIVTEHFKSWKMESSVAAADSSVDTRVMIFSSFRDSVQEIADMLSRLSPVVRVMMFVGHSTGRSTKGFTQKEQLEVVKRFREGGYNTLVSTCVGEEGLDIGEVDLIVCFDAQKSPIRLVQRMGRTGRRRRGRIVVILAEGREERTYNQSQSNKKSIHKAIAGNKALRFYQHSPRMVPQGLNPKLHKMFITAEKYEPSSARTRSKERRSGSLQHKAALFVSGKRITGIFAVHDGAAGVRAAEQLLDHRFLAHLRSKVQNPKDEATQELSLWEWRLWQSRPFPTWMVEHSDRCQHFVSLMEMMERLRDEQGDCSYEREIQPHLHMEDVHVGRDKSRCSRTSSASEQKPRSSRKDPAHGSKVKPFVPDPRDNGSEFFSTFKVLKTPKRTGLNPEEPVDTKASGGLALPGDAERGTRGDEEELEVTFDLNAWIDWSEDSEGAARGCSAALEDGALEKAPRHADSGYCSLSAEKSPLPSDLFYLPESHRDSLAPARPPEEPAWLAALFSPVKRLLAQSPPSLNELWDCENTIRDEEPASPLQEVIPSGHSERAQDEACSVSSEAERSLPPFDNPEQKGTGEPKASRSPCLAKPVAPPEAAAGGAREEQPWDDSFESLFDSEELTDIQSEGPAGNPTLTSVPWDAHTEEGGLGTDKRCVTPQEERSGPEHGLGDTRGGRLSGPSEGSVRDGSGQGGSRLEAEPGPAWFPAEKRRVAMEREELPASRSPAAPGDLGGTGQDLHDWDEDEDDPYDCSRELFSVTFDLGFSIEESEDEILEGGINADNTKKSDGASGPPADVKSTEDKTGSPNDSSRPEMSPRWDHKSLEGRDISTPLQSRSVKSPGGTKDGSPAASGLKPGDRRTGGGAPAALSSALPTPTSRKVLNLEARRRIPMRAFPRAREEAPEGSHPGAAPEDGTRDGRGGGSPAGGALQSPSRTESLENPDLPRSCVPPAEGTSSESGEEIVFQRRNRRKQNVLKSPEVSPGKRREAKRAGSQTLKQTSLQLFLIPQGTNSSDLESSIRDAARQFLDEEAELSQEGAEGVSSDESEDAGDELNSSLAQFLNDEAEVTQALNDTEMKGVYLQSVRSPALGTSYKMVHRELGTMEIFSQIPEQDESYAEDSFCVGEEDEEPLEPPDSSEEELCVNFDLLQSQSCAAGRKRYLTRRRKKLRGAGMEGSPSVPPRKQKPSRIIVLSDSSGEEASVSAERHTDPGRDRTGAQTPESLPPALAALRGAAAGDSRVPRPLAGSSVSPGPAASLEESGDLQARSSRCPAAGSASRAGKDVPAPAEVEGSLRNSCRSAAVPPGPAGTKPCAPAPLCVLVDSREICSGAEVISSLKAVHGVKVQVCSLSSDYIVSSRLAVERRFLSEFLSPASRNKLAQRIQRLWSMFERICVIVEKDKAKPGETSRFLQRTHNYDATLAALVRAGVRILFSSGQGETAALLKDLALVELRKNAAIRGPTEVEEHKRDLLGFYLSIPNLSHLAALNMCRAFGSIREMANSSPQDLAAGAQLSQHAAAEIHRYLHYGFEAQLLPESPRVPGGSGAAARS
ncbi:FANCM protein, partial [Centropus bengalensis]|nr:FANCM protein [Centropus bengalensis]